MLLINLAYRIPVADCEGFFDLKIDINAYILKDYGILYEVCYLDRDDRQELCCSISMFDGMKSFYIFV